MASSSKEFVGSSQMASSQTAENVTQFKTCRCGEGDTNIWTARNSDSSDKQSSSCPSCQVGEILSEIFKSGPLFISSKGIGWTSWKKRWFILTHTSLVFFRTDPNAPPVKGSEPNVTLGGIDLNNSGSVVVKADKKLLTVLFPDGRDGRTFTLKAETSEDLYEWKTALENAIAQAPSAQAPSAALPMVQNGILRNDIVDPVEAPAEQWKDRPPVKSMVVGRPILLALEDIDGSPSFLEKALRFIEQYGIKVEGILRQSADVEEVERRVRDYEQGKDEFSPEEDAHVVGDCIKHVLREMPSSPVPASCCTTLVEAYRTDRGGRIDAMRTAIYETFPEPSRRLVQRILKMMQTVAVHKSVNRMTLSALAACMAPLLLRPLLAGDCEFEDDFNMGGDGSIQLLKAAAAANHAQAIVMILLEEYDKIFDENLLQEGSMSSELYTESEEDGDVDDNYSTDHDIPEDDGYHDAHHDLDADIDDNTEQSYSGTESCSDGESDVSGDKASKSNNIDVAYHKDSEMFEPSNALESTAEIPAQENKNIRQNSSPTDSLSPKDVVPQEEIMQYENSRKLAPAHQSCEPTGKGAASSTGQFLKSISHALPSRAAKFSDKSNDQALSCKRPTIWGRTSARKNLSMESIDYSSEEEIAIQRLENTKTELHAKIAKEVKGNQILQASLEKRKEALHERRLALEQDVERLREQLQKERNLRASLESGLMNMRRGQVSYASAIDSKTRADLEEVALAEADIFSLKQKIGDLRGQLNNQLQESYTTLCESCNKRLSNLDSPVMKGQQEGVDSTILVKQNGTFSKCDDILDEAHEKLQLQTQGLPSTSSDHSQNHNSESTSQNDTLPSNVSCSSSSTGATAQSKKVSAENNEANREELKAEAQESFSLKSGKPLQKQKPNAPHQSNKPISSCSINPIAEEPTIASQDDTQSTSSGENAMHAADSESVKVHKKDSVSSSDKKHIEKQQTSTTNLSSAKSSSPTSIASNEQLMAGGQNSVSKKHLPRGENVKKEAHDLSSSFPKRQPSEKHQFSTMKPQGSSSVTSPEELAAVDRVLASKKISSRAEEVGLSSSSALAKLTNRLNFLKERRAQLVNELQNLDSNRTLGPTGPPPRTNSR
ncbi:rho GTPase-activating protein REN1-like isoform X2 [Ananas comosus]|uniref:Rho GTPase-activating protein REN1-like isoform X2 n=1 Tax=Ananas comosus TaxID=4615 RepID=A0A6P5GGM4_ANACO|nr:rho GTPase-activating protein REN1-like isoform X2 [Ananas comosus]